MAHKLRKCKNCKAEFVPRLPLQSVCDYKCATEIAIKKRTIEGKKALHQQKRELKAAKDKIKPLGFFKAKAQAALNKWIVHVRDKGLGCVSCGKMNVTMQGGHYLARSIRGELALTPENIHAQCIHCNLFNKNAHHAYRVELIKRIGLERVEWLESPHEPAKWSKQDLLDIEAEYKLKLKGLK